MAVTRDATSGWWYPATAAEVTALYSGRGIGAPVHGYQCQDAAGNLADFIGSLALVKFNAPQYQVAFPGHTRKAIAYNANNDCHFYSPVTANDVGDISNVSTSILIFGAAANSLGSAPPTQVKNMINLGSGANARNFQWSATSKYQIAGGGGQATGTGTATPGASAHPAIFEINRGGAAIAVQDDQETIAPAYTAPAGGTAYMSIGPDAVGDAGQTLTLVGYMLMWAGAAAQFTAANRASIIDCHINGPAVASVAVTPTPVGLSIGGTQQLTATATRTDATTFDCTDGTNVPSSATATWASDNPAAATVSASGLVTAVGPGTANITRSFTSLNAATATSNTSVVTVSGLSYVSISITPAVGQCFIGGTKQFTAIGTKNDGTKQDVTSTAAWSSSNPAAATVAAGLASGLSIGGTIITATINGHSDTSMLTVLVNAGAAGDLADQQAAMFGEDIWYDVSHPDDQGFADLIVDAGGDWQDVTGIEALRQSLLRRMITSPGEWQTVPEYGVGARQYIKAPMTPSTIAELESRIRSQYLRDDRVESIDSITITPLTGNLPGIYVLVNVIPKGRLRQDVTLPVAITIT